MNKLIKLVQYQRQSFILIYDNNIEVKIENPDLYKFISQIRVELKILYKEFYSIDFTGAMFFEYDEQKYNYLNAFIDVYLDVEKRMNGLLIQDQTLSTHLNYAFDIKTFTTNKELEFRIALKHLPNPIELTGKVEYNG